MVNLLEFSDDRLRLLGKLRNSRAVKVLERVVVSQMALPLHPYELIREVLYPLREFPQNTLGTPLSALSFDLSMIQRRYICLHACLV